jgi:hypothetical protein
LGTLREGAYSEFLENGSTAMEEVLDYFGEAVRECGDGQAFEPVAMRERQKERVVQKGGASIPP